MTAEQHEFRAEVSALLNLVSNSLYTNREIFLRELISNASDALDKARFLALVDSSLEGQEFEPQIRLEVDREARKLVIEDNGVGMTREEAATNLGTIAHSGTLQMLLEQQKEGQSGDLNLIGQFGVGFYSAFMVAEEVRVETRSAKAGQEPVVWSSKGDGKFELSPGHRGRRGSRIELTLKEDAAEFLERYRLEGIVKRYSNYVMHPIVWVEDANAEGESAEPSQINAATPFWARKAKDLSEEDHAEFYKHVMGGFVLPGDEALGRLHLSLEAPIQFQALLYVPGRAPADLFMESRRSLQLFARRVLVMENCDKLLPAYLRFFRGVVDTEDLPLNVSRETLQEDKNVAAIRRQLTRKALKLLAEIADEDKERYDKLWNEFGAVIKEGLHSDGGHRKQLMALLRFRTAGAEGLQSLSQYIEAMPEGQETIWYIAGQDADKLARSPHLEAVRARGEDVLLMTDPVDEWVVQSVREHEGKSFRSVTQGELDEKKDEDSESEGEDKAADDGELAPLLQVARAHFEGRVRDVRPSKRLTNTAACLIDDAGGLSRNMERLLRMSQRGGEGATNTLRILELNPEHKIVHKALELAKSAPEGAQTTETLDLLLDLAAMAEGEVLDPAGAVARVQRLIEAGL